MRALVYKCLRCPRRFYTSYGSPAPFGVCVTCRKECGLEPAAASSEGES